MHASPAGRGRHMVLPAWMTRGPQPAGAAPAFASASPAVPTPQKYTPPAVAAPSLPVVAAPAAAAAAVAAPLPSGPVGGGTPCGTSNGASVAAEGPHAGAVPHGGTPGAGGALGKWMRERSAGRRDSREREKDRDRERDRDRDSERDRRKRSRSPRRRSRSPRRRSRSPKRNGREHDRERGRDRRRSRSTSRYTDEGLSASMLADRLVEARQMSSRKREDNRDVFLSWLCPKDFYSEDRQGNSATREAFVNNLIDFQYSVRVTKRLIAEENKNHSFCLDFEEVKGGKNQINLYECRSSKLTRVYSFRDSEDLTKEKLLFEELKKTRIYQKAFKYFTKKGVPDNAKLVYHDYLNDPEIVVG